ncbi:MAG: GC-type dockerin domain-anchored protein [Phycisphaerales bacterium]
MPFSFRPSSNSTARVAGLVGITTLLASVGCANSTADRVAEHGITAPFAALPAGDPAWTRPGKAASELPPPIKIENGRSVEERMTQAPIVIDTTTFANQIQVKDPWDGTVGLVKSHLPVHSRDKSLPTRDAQPLPEGSIAATGRASSTGVSFAGIQQTPWSPPDPTIAVGPLHIVETVNQSIAFFQKDGTLDFSAPLGSPGSPGFFEGQGAENFTFDPKCFYDHNAERFVVIALEVYSPTEAWIDIAVSDDSNPNGVWYKYRTNSVINLNNSTYWVDYPGFGFDDDAFYISNNLFLLDGPGSGFGGVAIRVFDKAPLLTGAPAEFYDLVPGFGASMQIAQTHGDATQPYFVDRSASNALRIWSIIDPLGSSPQLVQTEVSGLATAFGPNDAPNGSGGEIDALDGRLMNVHWRDGNLYTTHGIEASGGRSRARWYHFETNGWPASGSSPALVQQGNIDVGGQNHFFPAIASDKFGRVGMAMARSASNQFASVAVTGREPTDPAGQMDVPLVLATGTNTANGRWGDYFDIALDPNDDRTFWYVGQTQRNFGWQTEIGSFLVGCPADENGDGLVNFFDISTFIAAYSNGELSSDISPPYGTLNFFDVAAFIDRYGQGCP